MEQLHSVRRTYGGVYLTLFPSGLAIPWKPLSLCDWTKYSQDYNRGLIVPSQLEDEIFLKCVLDSSAHRQMDYWPAGIVSTVVLNIWEYSGPANMENLATDLMAARGIVSGDGTRLIYDLGRIVMMAFPYKPEEVYAMDYETFMLRVAEAEQKLLSLGVIQEPVQLSKGDGSDIQHTEAKGRRAPTRAPQKKRVDAKRLWEQQQQQPQQAAPTEKKARDKWWKVSPVLEAKDRKPINFNMEQRATDAFSLDSHDLNEPEEVKQFILDKKTEGSRAKLIEEARVIYADLLASLEQKKQK